MLLWQIGFDTPGVRVSFDNCPAQLANSTAKLDASTAQSDPQQVTSSLVAVDELNLKVATWHLLSDAVGLLL